MTTMIFDLYDTNDYRKCRSRISLTMSVFVRGNSYNSSHHSRHTNPIETNSGVSFLRDRNFCTDLVSIRQLD